MKPLGAVVGSRTDSVMMPVATVDLISPFTPEECATRLRAELSNPASEVVGPADVWRVELSKKLPGRNPLQTVLIATLAPDGTGTRIAGKLGIHPGVKLFAYVWFGIVGFIGLVAAKNGFPLPGSLVPPAMILFVATLFWLVRRSSRDQGQFLVEFVTRALDAKHAVDLFAK